MAAVNEDHPVLMADSSGIVGAIVVRDLGEVDTRRIAFFEESGYTPATHRVRLADTGQMVDTTVRLTSSFEACHEGRGGFATQAPWLAGDALHRHRVR